MMLNARQSEVVRSTDGFQIVVAGPGTGKTHTLACRVAHLLGEKGVPASRVMAVTFTRAAAAEMRERLRTLLPEPLRGRAAEVRVDTFHAAALELLRRGGHPFGPGVEFSVVSEDDKPSLAAGLAPRKELPALLDSVRRAKQALAPLPEGPAAEYQRRLAAARLLDFDDLLVHACELLDAKPEVRGAARPLYLLVDEFQDTSLAQYGLMRRLAGGNVSVIGDPDQAIYSFSGSSFDPFARFREDFPASRVLGLTENYRSRACILDAALQVIGRSAATALPPRELVARLERGLPLEVSPHRTERQEAEMIARRIEGLLGGASAFTVDTAWARKEDESFSYGLDDIAVLYRFHAQAARIAEALGRAGLPVTVYGRDSQAADGDDFRSREDAAPSAFLPRREAISLMTLHRSKGQEFPVVFIAGCEEGVLPWPGRDDATLDDARVEDERRLFYVGMTRAKSRLFLSHAGKRFLFGKAVEGGPSRFLSDIEEQLRLLRESAPPRKRPAKASQPSLFELG